MSFRRYILSVVVTTVISVLTACGGGGGGGGGYIRPDPPVIPPPSLNQVPFSTPTKVADVVPLSGTGSQTLGAYTEIASADLTGTGKQNVIITSMINPRTSGYNTAGSNGTNWFNGKITILGWQGDNLVDQTSQWFATGENSVMGPAYVRFGDFLGNGKIGLFVPTYTDLSGLSGPGYVFLNNGSNFTRVAIDQNGAFAHDSIVSSFTSSGRPDIFILDYGTKSNLNVNNGNGTFTMYTTTGLPVGGTSVAVGDYLGNGTKTVFVGDSGFTPTTNNQIYSYTLDNANRIMSLTSVVTLPPGIFDTPAFASVQQGNTTMTHNIRALTFDFDNSGTSSLVLVQSLGGAPVTPMSAVQFLKNNGSGVFTDVTQSTLVGWNYNSMGSYNPQLLDVNGDGLTDIFLPSANGQSIGSTSVLIHTREHKYVTSYVNVFSAFQNQAQAQQLLLTPSYAYADGNALNLVQGPNGIMYLVTSVDYISSNGTTKSIYLSRLGATTVTAQATATAVKQQWPWMSDGQVNTVLAQTSTTWFGLNVLNPDAALSPYGSLSLTSNGRTLPTMGFISGIDVKDSINRLTMFDSLGRNFNVNYSVTNVNSVNYFARNIDNIVDDTRASQVMDMPIGYLTHPTLNNATLKIGGDSNSKTLAFGVTGIDIGHNLSLSAQYTQLPFSPFLQMMGSYGTILSSTNLETTLSYRNQGYVSKTGIIHSGTEFTPGLVNRVSGITSVWAETGYEWKNFKLYSGVLPKVVGGSVNLTVPIGVDNLGRVVYNNINANVTNPTVGYARFQYTEWLNKQTLFMLHGLTTTQRQTNVYGELKFLFR